jgi:lipopolysaccharide export system protein LptA
MPTNKVLSIIILYMLATNVFALRSDNIKPLQIEANQATVNQKNMTSVFTGNVVITKGSLVIHANTGMANQDANGGKIIVLDGNPINFVQLQDDLTKVSGQCNRFTYNTKTGIAVLSGRARVVKGANIVIGDTIIYNTKTQIYTAQSNFINPSDHTAKSGRVTVIIDQAHNNAK